MKTNNISESIIGDITYRLIRSDDRAKLLSFFDSLSEEAKHFFSPHPFSPEAVDKILNDTLFPNPHLYFIAENRNNVIGYAFLGLSRFRKILDHLNIRWAGLGIAVNDNFRNGTVASEFLSYILNIARKELKLGKVMAFVYEDNSSALAFFEKHGFKVEKEMKDRASPRRMLRMSLALTSK